MVDPRSCIAGIAADDVGAAARGALQDGPIIRRAERDAGQGCAGFDLLWAECRGVCLQSLRSEGDAGLTGLVGIQHEGRGVAEDFATSTNGGGGAAAL